MKARKASLETLEKYGRARDVDLVERLFTDADRTFFLPMRVRMNEKDEIEHPFMQHSWIYAAVNAKATAISGVPFRIKKGRRNDPNDQGEELGSEDPIVRLFRNPNELMNGTQFIEALSISLDLCGEAIWVARDTSGGAVNPAAGDIPDSFVLTNPKMMEPTVSKTTKQITGWVFGKDTPDQQTFTFEQTGQIKTFNPENPFRGLPPLAPLKGGLNVDHKVSLFTQALLNNGADPGGILTTDLDLKPEQVEVIRQEWHARHQGVRNRGKVAILQGGLRYEPIEVSARELEFMAQREWTREEILAVFKVPMLEVGLVEDVNRSTARETKRLFWQNTLIPRVRAIEDYLWTWFFEPFSRQGGREEVWLEFDLSSVEALREDFAELLEQASSLQTLGYSKEVIDIRLGLDMKDAVEAAAKNGDPTDADATQAEEEADEESAEAEEEQEAALLSTRIKSGELIEKGAVERLEVSYRDMEKAVRSHIWNVRQEVISQIRIFQNKHGRIPRPSELDQIVRKAEVWRTSMRARMQPAFRRTNKRTLLGLKDELSGLSNFGDREARFMDRLMKRRLKGLDRIVGRHRSALRTLLSDHVKSGEATNISFEKVARNFFGDLARGRSEVISRTESGIQTNAIRKEVMLAEGVTHHKWLTSRDKKVRHSHDPMHGQTVPIGEAFVTGNGRELEFPLDPNGPPEEVVNCRCVAVAVNKE